MAKITTESTPVLSGGGEWNIYDWITFHKALANKFYTNTQLVKKDGNVVVAKNMAADMVWLTWWRKRSFFGTAQTNILDTNSKYDDARKYLGMWENIANGTGIKQMTSFNPIWASVKVTRDVGDAIGSGVLTGLKVASLVIPVIVGVLLLGIVGYGVNALRTKTYTRRY